MRIELTPYEARVIGCLIEKEVTTPDQYPLSLSALTNACNQKSSREPVLQLSEVEVQEIVDGLLKKHLVSDRSGFGSLEFSKQELGVLCVLLLRGPQTPGELRGRTNRLCEFSDMHETESVLQGLMERDDGPFVARLPREPGKRESRYMQLFSGEPELASYEMPESSRAEPIREDSQQRIEQLENLLLELQEKLEAVEARLARLEENP